MRCIIFAISQNELFNVSGAKWQSRRKTLTPTFHFNILTQFVRIFAKETNQFLDKLEEQCDKPFVDIMPLVTDFALKSICGTKLIG